MRIIKGMKELTQFLRVLQSRAAGGDGAVESTVRKIIEDVRENGDESVIAYSRKFDNVKMVRMRLSVSEIKKAAAKADPKVVKAIGIAARRIRKFHSMQVERSWFLGEHDIILGQSIRPLSRVGGYIPGGKAAYPSSVLMNVIPAQVAGVKEIALCIPAPAGQLNPHVMAAVQMLGITEVYRIGGAQAVAAMAYGTKTIRKVDKIVGPGNIYVATAKRLVFGVVDIDMIAGPSEILIIADDTADASFISADLLSQAEHDELASSILLTPSRDLALRVSAEVERQLSLLRREKIARSSLENYGAVILTKDLPAAVRIANTIAPEHLEIMTERPTDILPDIDNAGAVFIGPWTPEALGDYAAGPNHTLPTGGTARFFSPLGVYDFYKRSSLIGFSEKSFRRISGVVERLADMEGLEAHANTVRLRRQKIGKGTTKVRKDRS